MDLWRSKSNPRCGLWTGPLPSPSASTDSFSNPASSAEKESDPVYHLESNSTDRSSACGSFLDRYQMEKKSISSVILRISPRSQNHANQKHCGLIPPSRLTLRKQLETSGFRNAICWIQSKRLTQGLAQLPSTCSEVPIMVLRQLGIQLSTDLKLNIMILEN